jgi:hypothetical protein
MLFCFATSVAALHAHCIPSYDSAKSDSDSSDEADAAKRKLKQFLKGPPELWNHVKYYDELVSVLITTEFQCCAL